MKQFLSVLFLIVSLTMQASKIVTDTFKSNVLQAEVKYNVYLPDGFGESQETYPVVYLLHGFGQDYQAWCNYGRMQDAADELIETGEACKMVIVMPNAGGYDTMKEWNGYMNMPGWNYEDFFFTEFLPQIEKKYNIKGNKEHRAIMGLSMGGGGTVIYGQRHPDMFSACYAMSAWLDFSGDNNFPKDSKPYLVQESVREHSAVRFMEKADEKTLERLRSVKWFFDCGDDDFLLDSNVRMHQLMRDNKIKDELRVRNGQHNWEYWHQALRIALPFVTRSFGK